MKRGAPPPAPSTAIRTHEAAREEGQSRPRLRELGGGRRERTRDLEIDGSEMPRCVLLFFCFFPSSLDFYTSSLSSLTLARFVYKIRSLTNFIENNNNIYDITILYDISNNTN